MPLRIAVQMDPLGGIDIAGDSTFALMLGAQARGHRLFHYAPEALNHRDGRVWAEAHPVTVQRVPGDHFRFEEPVRLDLGADSDVVLMRQDPPFDLGYITATHLLERVQGETLVLNDAASVRNAPEKIWVLDFARFMPPTLITRSLAQARAFVAEHGEAVMKPLSRTMRKASSRSAATRQPLLADRGLQHGWREPHIVRPSSEIAHGDKPHRLHRRRSRRRSHRLPGEGEIRSNLAGGGILRPRRSSRTGARDLRGDRAGAQGTRPVLRRHRRDRRQWLTEINVTSPDGHRRIDRFNGTDTPALFWNGIEARLG
jgi:glutathione synthase